MKDKRTILIGLLIIWNFYLTFKTHFIQDSSFRIINAERINIVEKDGTKKLGIFSSGQYELGTAERQGQNQISGMLFFNEEGLEAGGLVYRGKEIDGGQNSSAGLMFDGYRQDQTIALQHNEQKTDSSSFYEDGLRIMSRPDRADIDTEYDFYALKYPDQFGDENTPRLSPEEIDSIDMALARLNKVAKQRIYLGSKRGLRNGEWFDESGLYVQNKYGKTVIKIFVDQTNRPKISIYDSLGSQLMYDLIPTESIHKTNDEMID